MQYSADGVEGRRDKEALYQSDGRIVGGEPEN